MTEVDDDPTVRAGPRVQTRDLPRGFVVDHFVILGRLGAGGHGSVYAAWDSQLGRRVALKVLHTGIDVSEEDRSRMVREARALAQLADDHVVRVYALGELEGTPFVVMEFVEGRSLEVMLKSESPSPEEIIRIFRAAGRGLAAVHRLGIVHRDIKPANILVGSDGRVCIGDFGLAVAHTVFAEHNPGGVSMEEHPDLYALSAGEGVAPSPSASDARDGDERTTGRVSIDDLPAMGAVTPSVALDLAALDEVVTRVGSVAGTPSFMAPEQLRGERLDVRCDQFAFCLAFWRALWGVDPFGRFQSPEHRLEAFDHPPVVPPTFTSVARVLMRGLSEQPDARFPHMQALLNALDAALARPRRRALAAVVVAAACGLVVGGVALVPAADPCNIERRIAHVLTDDDRRMLAPPPTPSDGPAHPEGTISGAGAHLDAWLAHWGATARKTCTASPTPADRAVTECLDRRFDEVTALVAVLRARGSTAWSDALPAVVSLLPPQVCVRAAQEGQGEVLDAHTLELQQKLHHAQATWTTGKSAEARALAEVVVRDAHARGLPKLESEARLLVGRASTDMGDLARAEEELRGAISLAMNTRRARTEADAWVELVRVVGDRSRRFEEAARLVPLMNAAAARLDDDVDLLARAALAQALTWNGLAAPSEAKAAIDEAVRLARRRVPVDARNLSRALMVRGIIEFSQGEAQAALRSMDETEAVLEQNFPAGHVTFAAVANNRGYMLRDLGRLDEAEASFGRAAAIFEAYGTDQAPSHAVALMNRVHIAHDRGRLDVARATAVRARDILRAAMGSNHEQVGRIEEILGQIAQDEGDFTMAEKHQAEVDRIRASIRPRAIAQLDAAASRALMLVERDGVPAVPAARALIEAVGMPPSDITHETMRAAVARSVLALFEGDSQGARALLTEAERQHAKLSAPATGGFIRVVRLLAAATDAQRADPSWHAQMARQCLALPRNAALPRVIKMACGVDRRAPRAPGDGVTDDMR